MNEIKVEVMSESTCRLCLFDSEDSQLMFDRDSTDSTPLDAWVEDLTTLKIMNISNAPASLCSKCRTILKDFDEFRKMCISNNIIFNKLFVNVDQKNGHSNKSSIDDAVENLHTEYEVSNVMEMIESTQSDLLQTSIEIVKIEIEENTLNSNNQNEPLNKQQAEPTKNEDKPKVRGLKACPVCNMNVKALGKHISTQHKDYQPFQCEYCSQRFNVHGNLLMHIRRHLQIKSHVCQYCEKGFINADGLKVHIRIHTNEKPYTCAECGKSFKTTGSLQRHKMAHSGIRPHECEVCPAKFYTAYHLRKHMTVHTLERAYSCKVCNKRFTRPEAAKVNAHKCIKS